VTPSKSRSEAYHLETGTVPVFPGFSGRIEGLFGMIAKREKRKNAVTAYSYSRFHLSSSFFSVGFKSTRPDNFGGSQKFCFGNITETTYSTTAIRTTFPGSHNWQSVGRDRNATFSSESHRNAAVWHSFAARYRHSFPVGFSLW
jgi:hypothetical protein